VAPIASATAPTKIAGALRIFVVRAFIPTAASNAMPPSVKRTRLAVAHSGGSIKGG
jgi:hypothetical protein